MKNSKVIIPFAVNGFSVITDVADLSIAIINWKVDAGTLQARLHGLLLSAVWHADTHKNNNLLLEVLDAIPQGVNFAAVMKWLEQFTAYDFKPARSATALKTGSKARILKSSRLVSFTRTKDIQKASLTPFYALKAKASKGAAKKTLIQKLQALSKSITDDLESLDSKEIQAIVNQLIALQNALMPVAEIEIVAPVETVETVQPTALELAIKTASKGAANTNRAFNAESVGDGKAAQTSFPIVSKAVTQKQTVVEA